MWDFKVRTHVSRARVSRGLLLAAPFLLLALTLRVLDRPIGMIPPLARFLNPFVGAWVGPDDDLKMWGDRLEIPGLVEPVTVRIDKDRIKHIFARNDHDLYLAQGYVVASDRLWQMEFIARVAGGRLSEVFGSRTIDFDKMFVKLGVPEAAAETVELMYRDELTKTALEAYAAGVNAYIAKLSEKNLPFEYKLLNYHPEPWTPLKSALLLKFMAYNLSFKTNDLGLTRSLSRLAEGDFNQLFPIDFDAPDPIVPKEKTWNFKSLAPEPPARLHQVSIDKIMPLPTPHPSNGSNNWAVAGKKSTTGRPIVSNDVHLGYSLPALWYQIQLSAPSHNVYGATIPGSPGIVLGFNANVAWAVTNAGTDIVDWFDLRFRDNSKNEYLHDGGWRPIISRDRYIQVRGQKPEHVTLRRTQFGPIVYDASETPVNPTIPRGLAMRWGALDASNELKSFLELNRSKKFKDCQKAIERYESPAQNFICADQVDVGIFHEGRFPIRWKGQGRLISDGADSLYDWHAFIPRNEVPQIINPSRGFVSSANQSPAGSSYPYYIGWPYEVPYRGMRINDILRSKNKFSPEDFVAMQGDVDLKPAHELIPIFMKRLSRDGLTRRELSALEVLEKWNFNVDVDSAGATIFDKWWTHLQDDIWSDQFPDPRYYFVPRPQQTAQMILEQPDAKWFDRIETDEKETLDGLLKKSFQDSVRDLAKTMGNEPARWVWAKYQPALFPHLGRLPGLGSQPIPVRGQAYSIFANQGDHGPVWKSVVALGPEIRAWGIYPGGQSGHPGSRYYDNFLNDWASGKMRELQYLKNEESPLKNEFKQVHFISPHTAIYSQSSVNER